MSEVIDDFRGEHAFLSNFYPSTVHLYGHDYETVEHAYQAAKAIRHHDRMEIRAASTPGKAKRLGRKVNLRPDWERTKVPVMHRLVRRKFDPRDHPVLTQALLATGEAELIEGNTWGDRFWGATWDHERGWVGSNHLGIILMATRDEIRSLTQAVPWSS